LNSGRLGCKIWSLARWGPNTFPASRVLCGAGEGLDAAQLHAFDSGSCRARTHSHRGQCHRCRGSRGSFTRPSNDNPQLQRWSMRRSRRRAGARPGRGNLAGGDMDLNRRIEAAATFLRLQGCEASRFVGMWLTSAEGRAIKRQWVEPERRESPSHFLSRLPAMLISTSSGEPRTCAR
jgi:hypothetical protein